MCFGKNGEELGHLDKDKKASEVKRGLGGQVALPLFVDMLNLLSMQSLSEYEIALRKRTFRRHFMTGEPLPDRLTD